MPAIASSQISTAARKADGVVYTPPHVARYIVRQTLDPMLRGKSILPLSTLRVLDPACGEGVFLIEAFHYLLAHYRRLYVDSKNREKHCRAGRLKLAPNGLWCLTATERKRILQKHIYGVELNRSSVKTTVDFLARTALEVELDMASPSRVALDTVHSAQHFILPLDKRKQGHAHIASKATRLNDELSRLKRSLAKNIRSGDALIESDFYDDSPAGKDNVATFDWQTEFDGPFDAIVGNPPYVNIRLLSKHHGPTVKRYLQNRYRCAHRAYDLYVLFMERAQSLLKPGGTCGMIVPNKLATLDYAQPCRRLLVAETTLLHVDDVSGLDIFPGTGVYPYIVVWQKNPPPRNHAVPVLHARNDGDLSKLRATRHVQQSQLTDNGWNLHGTLNVEDRVPTAPLAQRATLHSGATGFTAQRLAAALIEKEKCNDECFEFIVSGNIDRYEIRRGNVRFMKRRFARPMLPSDDAGTSNRKRELYRQAKIVIAGMTKRLEAAWDAEGLALGVQVFAATEMKDHPYYLLGLLNSKLLSHLFRIRFAAKRLSGGYLAINKGQLAKLPIRHIDFKNADDRRGHDEIVRCVEKLLARPTTSDRRIDELVYELYSLTEKEIKQVESKNWN